MCCARSRPSIQAPPRGTKPGGECNGIAPTALSAMALFHFDVRYDDRPWSDDATGSELDGVEEARKEAFELARQLAKDQLDGTREIAIRVRDGKPEPIMSLRVRSGLRNGPRLRHLGRHDLAERLVQR